MRKLLLILILSLSLFSRAQTDTSEVEFDTSGAELDTSVMRLIKIPDSTGFGLPDGKLVSKEIGDSGGLIISDDGRVELIFPEGALTTNTMISIQPVSNMLNGSDKAYKLEPSGTQFKKPVKITFHYTDEEAATCPPDLKSFALQDQNGKWTFFEYDEWDSTNKALSGLIHHFTTVIINESDVSLWAPKERIQVTRKINIYARLRVLRYVGGQLQEVNEAPNFLGNQLGWFVNTKLGGDRIIGTVTEDRRAATIREFTGQVVGLYHAPEYLPRDNPVFITLAFQYYSRLLKKRVWGKSSCRIFLYDEYKIEIQARGVFGLVCDAEITDKASFHIRTHPNWRTDSRERPEFRNVENEGPLLIKQADCGSDSKFKYDVTGCPGPVNVNSSLLTDFKISYDPPEIILDFTPAIVLYAKANGKLYPEMKKQGPVYNIGRSTTVGNHIKFQADGRQHRFPSYEGDCECEVTITITPIGR